MYLFRIIHKRDKDIESCIKREQECLNTITILKQDLEHSNQKVNEYTDHAKKLYNMAKRLEEENEVIASLKEANKGLNNRLRSYFAEINDLKTELELLRLEKKKFEILMREKDNEIELLKKDMAYVFTFMFCILTYNEFLLHCISYYQVKNGSVS